MCNGGLPLFIGVHSRVPKLAMQFPPPLSEMFSGQNFALNDNRFNLSPFPRTRIISAIHRVMHLILFASDFMLLAALC